MADTYSWDTSVVLAWFKGEDDKPLEDIELVFREIESQRADLVVSIMTYSEVLAVGESEDAAELYRKFLQRSNVLQVNVDPPVAAAAVKVREMAKTAGVKCPKAADAQIIAFAILYQVDVLHSFDSGMINLSESDIVEGLRISRPRLLSGQTGLFKDKDTDDAQESEDQE